MSSDLQDFSIPQWLNSFFIKSVLEAKFPQEPKVGIYSLNVEVGSNKGDGMVSEMFRLKVESSVGKFSLILKKPHSCEEKYNIMVPYNMFHKEIVFYANFFPAIRAALESVEEYETIVPEMFYADKASEVIILDDLKPLGYTTLERHKRVSYEEALILMRKLAKLHAGSMVANAKEGGQFAVRTFDSFRVDGAFRDIMLNHVRAFHGELLSWGEEFAAVADKWELFTEHFLRLAEENILSRRELNVLIHADLWFTNVMAKHASENAGVEDVLLIDFQTSSWGSLAIDLLHFCFTSLNEEDYEQRMDELIGVYQGHLERVLRKHKWGNVPTKEEILREVDDKIVHGELNGDEGQGWMDIK